MFRTRLSERMMPFNLTISNVPGPQMPLYLDGAEQLASYPYSTITDGMALNITVTSYNGHLDWGIVVDRDIVTDPWAMYDGLVDAHAELLELATSTRPRRLDGRAPGPDRQPPGRSDFAPWRPDVATTRRLTVQDRQARSAPSAEASPTSSHLGLERGRGVPW